MVEVKVKVNEVDVPLNPIMTNILSNVIGGFLDALKGVPEDRKEISVNIQFD